MIISVIIVKFIVVKRSPMLSIDSIHSQGFKVMNEAAIFYFFSFPSLLFIADQRVRYEVYFEWNAISIVSLNVDFDLIVIS